MRGGDQEIKVGKTPIETELGYVSHHVGWMDGMFYEMIWSNFVEGRKEIQIIAFCVSCIFYFL